MKFFFADDSTHKGAREHMGKLVAFGGLLLDGSNLKALSETTNSILKEFGAPEDEEVKWSPRKGSWIYENLGGDARLACYSRILQSAADLDSKVVVAVCDPDMRNLKPEWGFERCVTYALERVSTYLTKENTEWREAFPTGTKFKLCAKVTKRKGGVEFLYCHYAAPYEVLSDEEATTFIRERKPYER